MDSIGAAIVFNSFVLTAALNGGRLTPPVGDLTIGSHPNNSNEWVLRKLLGRGFHVCGVNVGESYGNPAGRKVYSEFHQQVLSSRV